MKTGQFVSKLSGHAPQLTDEFGLAKIYNNIMSAQIALSGYFDFWCNCDISYRTAKNFPYEVIEIHHMIASEIMES